MNKPLHSLIFVLLFCCSFTSGFTQVDWVGNMWPASGSFSTISQGDPFTIYVQAYEPGTTDSPGQGGGITCEIYYGMVTNLGVGESWTNITSEPMTYNTDIGNNDEYMGSISPAAGNYEFTCRCSDNGGGSWTYASLPSGNGLLTVDAAAPVNLSGFSAQKNNQSVQLEWQTASENNSDYFEVQKSADAKNWQVIGRRESQGFSASETIYSLIDEAPFTGKNYYRIRMVDFDGTASFSETKLVNIGTNKPVRVYPNPVVDHLQLEISAEQQPGLFTTQLFDSQGRIVAQQIWPADEHIQKIDITALNPGLFLYRLLDQNGRLLTQGKLLKI